MPRTVKEWNDLPSGIVLAETPDSFAPTSIKKCQWEHLESESLMVIYLYFIEDKCLSFACVILQ